MQRLKRGNRKPWHLEQKAVQFKAHNTPQGSYKSASKRLTAIVLIYMSGRGAIVLINENDIEKNNVSK